MKWVKASERLPVFSHRTISRFTHTQTPLFDVQEFLLKNPHRANTVEWLDESQPSGGKSAEFEHKERLDILEKHFGSDFYKTGQWHNAISDAMEEYAQQFLPSCGKSAEEINTEFRSIISHALLGCDTINIPKETWELVFDECTKYAQQYAHQQPVNDGWVRVEDGLPEYGLEVDVYKQYHNKVITAKRLSTDKRGVNWSCEYGHYITHWRLRPEPPKK